MLAFFKIGFLDIRFWDVVDILLVALLMYQVYKLLRGSLAFNIFIGYLLIYIAYLLVDFLEMNLLKSILGQFITAGFLAIFIIFQPEIRRFLLFIGRGSNIGNRIFWRRLFVRELKTATTEHEEQQFMRAINNLSKSKTGALIVFTQSTEEYFFSNTGVIINAEITAKLLETIFQKNTPLHDGAVVIAEKKVYAAGCVLPVSENPNLPPRIGMRHKAAVGISEAISSHVIVVSEETGKIAVAHKGNIRLNCSKTLLQSTLKTTLSEQY